MEGRQALGSDGFFLARAIARLGLFGVMARHEQTGRRLRIPRCAPEQN
jgi:hypothetical protein